MAAQEFVAAAVAYSNSSFGSGSAIGSKTNCIFNPSSTSSVVATLALAPRPIALKAW
jgi:hypothetical protein